MNRRSLLQTAVLGAGIFLLAPTRVHALGGKSPEIGIKAPDFDLQALAVLIQVKNTGVYPVFKAVGWSYIFIRGISLLVARLKPTAFRMHCQPSERKVQKLLPLAQTQSATTNRFAALKSSSFPCFLIPMVM